MDRLDSKRRSWAPAVASAILALLVYAVTLWGTYVYDDRAIVPLDKRVTQHQWAKFWTTDYFNGSVDNLYRPLVSMSYGIQWWLHGDRPWAFHLVNWLLHAAVAAMVAEFARRCAGWSVGLTAGLLFAIHPIHVEAVANIVGRAELACALGMFGALLVFTKHPLNSSRILGIFLWMAFALLCKEQALVLPLVLLALGWLIRPNLPTERPALRGLVIVVSWSTAGYLLFREHFLRFNWDRSFLDWAIQPMVRSVGLDRWLMPIVLLGHYFQLLIFPFKLSPDYGGHVIGWTVSFSDPYFWLGIAAFLAWCIAIVISLKHRAGFAVFCLLSLAFSYGLIGNVLVLIGTNLSERLMYLPSAFFLMFTAILLVRLPKRAWIAVLGALLLLGTIRTFTYARRWNDRLNFYVQCLTEQPKSTQLFLLVGMEYAERHDTTNAEAVLAQGCAEIPDSWRMWVERAKVAVARNRPAEAREYLHRSFELNATPDIYFDAQGRLEALEHHPPATTSASQEK